MPFKSNEKQKAAARKWYLKKKAENDPAWRAKRKAQKKAYNDNAKIEKGNILAYQQMAAMAIEMGLVEEKALPLNSMKGQIHYV